MEPGPSLPAPTLLVAEDSPGQMEALLSILRPLGGRLLAATTGEAAVATALETLPDLILLDVLMPGMGGMGVLRALKQDGRTAAIPVILVTARCETEDVVAGLEAGAADFIPKPFDASVLLARVRTHLDLKRALDHERSLVAELQATLAEMGRLSGMIPICAHCKKIRNDQGYWQQVEEYISSHTEALFTHGLCPECVPVFFPEMVEADGAPRLPKPAPARSTGPPLPRVLVVDDSPLNLQVLIQFLRLDYKILVATGGAVALELARREKPDLILLDIVMPDMDGYEVCRLLKRDPVTRPIPVIFLTSRGDEIDEMEGLDLGAVDYILKPFSLPLVHARIRTHLELKHYRDQLALHASRDELTDLQNRRGFQEFLELMWNQALRHRTSLSLILVNLDGMKAYNRRYGRAGGDECLRSVATALRNTKRRNTDLLARYGGQEFVCLLPGTERQEALVIAEMLREAVDQLAIPHAESGVADRVTVSVGLAACRPCAGGEPSALLEAASQALHRARQGGRNRVAV